MNEEKVIAEYIMQLISDSTKPVPLASSVMAHNCSR